MVKSKQIYSIQSYCDEFLGFCPFVKGNEDELRHILDTTGYEDLWDYPLDEIDHIVDLVDTSYVDDETFKIVSEYRWFEVPTEE